MSIHGSLWDPCIAMVHYICPDRESTMHAVTAFPQESISRCSLSGADAHYQGLTDALYWNRPYSTVVVVYIQWWPTWPFCVLEL